MSQLTGIDRSTANSTGHLITDYLYTEVGLLRDINNRFNLTSISHYGYGYDAGNRLTQTTGTDGTNVITYEHDNQLKTVTKTVGTNESYQFNALGIRNSSTTETSDSRRVNNDGTYQYQLSGAENS